MTATEDDRARGSAPDPAAQAPREPSAGLRLKVRRAPVIPRFLLAGLVIGVIAGAAIDVLGPGSAAGYSPVRGEAYRGTLSGLLGELAGGDVAVVLDRRS